MLSKYTKRFDAMLQPHEWQMLSQVAQEMHCSTSAAFRHMIYAAHQHLLQHQPRCADGSHCASSHAADALTSAISVLAPIKKKTK